MTPACGRFDTLDDIFDQVAALEDTHAQYKMPIQQPQQQQQQPRDRSSKGDERGYRPYIPECANTTGGVKTGQ